MVGSYGDLFYLVSGDWENDRWDDGGQYHKRMNPHGWCFERFRTKGNFTCGNEECGCDDTKSQRRKQQK